MPYSVVFFFFLPSELDLVLSHPFCFFGVNRILSHPICFFGVNRVALLGKGGLSLGQLLLETFYLGLGC
jgi:hypothetical protein